MKRKRGDTVGWESCWDCGAHYMVIFHKQRSSATPTKTTLGCDRCNFMDACERYRKQFLLDLENKISVDIGGERQWIVDSEDRTIPRIARTLRFAIKRIGIIEADAALVWAMKNYWHKVRSSWVHNLQCEQSSRLQ